MGTKISVMFANGHIAGEMEVHEAHSLVDYDIAVFDANYDICLHHKYAELSDAEQDLRFFRDGKPRSY